MTATTTKTTPTTPPPTKALLEPGAVAFGIITGTLFLTMAMLDLSVAYFVTSTDALNTPFLFQYYIWKGNAPLLKPLLTAITLLVPIAILQAVVGVVQVFTHKATPTRNVVDVLTAIAFALVIYLNVAYFAAYQEFVLASALAGKVDDVSREYIVENIPPLIAGLVLNFVMLVLPIIAYVSQVNGAAAASTPTPTAAATAPAQTPAATATTTTAPQKSKKD